MKIDRFLLGVNYWSRAGGPRMWERFDEEAVRAELTQMRALGLDACRAFAFVPSFAPRPPAVDEGALARFRRLLELAEAVGLAVFPTPLVGHMSGENFDFPGGGRALFTDATLLDWQRALVEALGDVGRGSPAVAGWVLSNEMGLWAEAAPPDAIEAWARTLVGALRARDGRPVGSGDGAMPGWPTRRLAPLLDWIGPHVYHGDSDPLRQALAVDLAVARARTHGRPVIVEEIGCSSTQAGEAEQAAYLREAIFATLGAGGSGLFAWCFSDFDAATVGRELPYSHHGFELGFGLTRADGSEKPVCDELKAARRFLDGIDLGRVRRIAASTVLLVPSVLEEEVPFSWQDRTAMGRTLRQAHALACQAGLDPDLVDERDDFSSYKLILVPATQKLETPTWLRLVEAARAGATVYWSYFSGDHPFHQGAWCPLFGALTGLRHRLRYGCFDLPGERMVLKGAVPLDVPTGLGRQLAEPWPLSRLPVEILDGAPVEVLASDGEGRPALFCHQLGAGQVLFLGYPLERYLSVLPDGSARDAHRLYRLCGERAGVAARHPTHHPDVQARVLSDGADELVVVQHRGWTPRVDDATEVPREAEIVFERAAPAGALGPKGVRVYRVRGR